MSKSKNDKKNLVIFILKAKEFVETVFDFIVTLLQISLINLTEKNVNR